MAVFKFFKESIHAQRMRLSNCQLIFPLLHLTFWLTCLVTISFQSYAETVVIVNKNTAINTLSKDDVRSIFLGRLMTLPQTDDAIKPLDQNLNQEQGGTIRKDFYHAIAHKSSRQIDAYWARLLFTGKAKPPTIVNSDKEVINLITTSPQYIGYVSSENLTPDVKVVYQVTP